MVDPRKLAQHEAAFGEPMRLAEKRADWWLKKWRRFGREGKGSGLLTALAFDREAELHQLAVSREAASRRFNGLDPK